MIGDVRMGVVILMLGPDRQGLIVLGGREGPSWDFHLEAGVAGQIWSQWYRVWCEPHSFDNGAGATFHRGGKEPSWREALWGVMPVLRAGLL